MRVSFIGRGPEAHTARTTLVQRTHLLSMERPGTGGVWSEAIHATDLTVLTTTDDGWPDHDGLEDAVAAILDVASFKSRRHGILFVGPLEGADLEALRRREDLCWYAHTDALGAPVHCDDLEGQRALERLLAVPTQGVRIAVAA